MPEIRVYYCVDLINEDSEFFQIKGKRVIKDGNEKIFKPDRIGGTETTLKELYRDGFEIVETIKLDSSFQAPIIAILRRG